RRSSRTTACRSNRRPARSPAAAGPARPTRAPPRRTAHSHTPSGRARSAARVSEERAKLALPARREGRRLAEPHKDALPVNMTLAAGPPEEVAERARAGLRDRYACFKVKVRLADDVAQVA